MFKIMKCYPVVSIATKQNMWFPVCEVVGVHVMLTCHCIPEVPYDDKAVFVMFVGETVDISSILQKTKFTSQQKY